MTEQTQQDVEKIGRWMEANDRFARLLGIKLDAISPGQATASLTITNDMLNAVNVTQGGVTFTLADFAFAAASNSHGTISLAQNASISFSAPSREGDRLIAEAREESSSRRTGLYTIEVRKEDGRLVGLFTGNVFRREDKLSDWIKD